MTNEEAVKMLTAKVECMERDIKGTYYECNTCFCDNCNLHYAQGTMGEQIEALKVAIEAMEAQKWVPCYPSELPKDKKLWVTHDRWGRRYLGEVFWDMTEWSDNVSDVVAYMPYVEPEPYIGEET